MAPRSAPDAGPGALTGDAVGTVPPDIVSAALAGSLPPRVPRTYVPRERLFVRLDRAVDGAVTLLVAPAGAGKTLGVSGWLRRRTEAAPSQPAALWLHADATWSAERLTDLLDAAAPTAAPIADGEPRLIVVDDAHLLPTAALRVVDQRLNGVPESLRLLLLSRWDLPFTRLVPELLGHFTILRGEVLRMDDDEAAALIIEHARSAEPEVLRAITGHAQGWCAAIVLTARAVAAAPDPVAAARRYARPETSIADRVASEVFSALHERQRHLLLCTAGEEVVSSSMAALLTRDPGAGDVLAGLETTGLLVSRVGVQDPAPELGRPEVGRPELGQQALERPELDPWDTGEQAPAGFEDVKYRIHPLLVEVVRRRLASGGVDVQRARATVARAVRLDLARGVATRAFDRLVRIGELDLAAEVLALEGLQLVNHGHGPKIAAFCRRYAEVVERHPATWLTIALERWGVDDAEGARRWFDRVLAHHAQDADDGAVSRAGVAAVRLMRARLGLEPIDTATAYAAELAERLQHLGHVPDGEQTLLPLLLSELGINENWLGDLTSAEAHLTAAVGIGRSRDLPLLAASAASHLAFTEYLAGRERACATLAAEVIAGLPSTPAAPMSFVVRRAELARLLSGLVDVPWAEAPEATAPTATIRPGPLHSADLCSRFWLRMRDARLQLLGGSVAGAERALTNPLDLPVAGPLPTHLHVALLVERAFLAALSSDPRTLRDLEAELGALEIGGEQALVAGLRADLAGDRRTAASLFADAAAAAAYDQPASRALALSCLAQLLDTLGEPRDALARLREAAGATEVRRNAVPFLGWSRQGTPIATLLDRLGTLDERSPSTWTGELAAASLGRPDVVALYAPTTATVRERSASGPELVPPALSPREREVLHELARGATYADIAANLFVSENTVKTHVSSLYGKLAASRRSEALAVARQLNLL